MNKKILLFVGIILIIVMAGRKKLTGLVNKFFIRGYDSGGSGAFGAKRGNRTHKGIDILTQNREKVFAPFDMDFKRLAFPYIDRTYKGAAYLTPDGLELKIFYMNPVEGKSFKKGNLIGYSQDIKNKYPNVPTHVHLEMRDKEGKLLDPSKYV